MAKLRWQVRQRRDEVERSAHAGAGPVRAPSSISLAQSRSSAVGLGLGDSSSTFRAGSQHKVQGTSSCLGTGQLKAARRTVSQPSSSSLSKGLPYSQVRVQFYSRYEDCPNKS